MDYPQPNRLWSFVKTVGMALVIGIIVFAIIAVNGKQMKDMALGFLTEGQTTTTKVQPTATALALPTRDTSLGTAPAASDTLGSPPVAIPQPVPLPIVEPAPILPSLDPMPTAPLPSESVPPQTQGKFTGCFGGWHYENGFQTTVECRMGGGD